LLFDFAQSGATTNRTLVDTALLTFEEQVNTFNIYSQEIGWRPADSLFVIFMGINVSQILSFTDSSLKLYTRQDIGLPILRNEPSDPTLQTKILRSYTNLVGHLFAQAGARNFLIISIPPLHRSPIIRLMGANEVERFRATASTFNIGLIEIANALRQAGGANVFYYDSNDLFQSVSGEKIAQGREN
jgi:phospholipase/lecithinase/hemolysin